MAMQSELGQEKPLIRSVLPWAIAAAALAVYLLTLNPWISMNSLSYVARTTGKIWMPELTGPYGSFGPFGPLLYLAAYPFRLLPEKWVPLGLNLFSALCSAITLGLLARSVMLLPHDRTHEQRQREHGPFALLTLKNAWIPPVLAAVVFGLQLTFWENATAISDANFQVMLFAYVVRCLLEYRIAPRNSWILRAALVYGAAMTGNWLMIGLLPAFIGAIIWIRGMSFFNLGFVTKLLLCLLAGLLLFLLLPAIYVLKGGAEMSFWDGLRYNLVVELMAVRAYFLRLPSHLLLLLGTTSMLPLLLMSIRWASHFGDPSKVGIGVTTAILHGMHGALLMACIWVAFDPIFSPRSRGVAIPELTYLASLSIGYFCGYFLLVFRPAVNRTGRIPEWQYPVNRLSQGFVYGLLILVPLGLLLRNLPQIRLTNGPAVKEYAEILSRKLPARAIVLGDSETRADVPIRLWLAEAWLTRNGTATNYYFADTLALGSPMYHQAQQRRYGKDWLPINIPKSAKRIPDVVLLSSMSKVSETMPVYYLSATFGYYMEAFSQRPHGLVYEMQRYATNDLLGPGITSDEVSENEAFWSKNGAVLDRLKPLIRERSLSQESRGMRTPWRRLLKIPVQPNATALILGRYYSQAADFFGVQLQHAGRWGEAVRYFDLALAMNPDNIAAKAALVCNQDLRAHRPIKLPPSQRVEEEFGRYSDWQQVVRDNGVFDDPLHCLVQALSFSGGHLYREAAQQFTRVHELDPDYPPAALWLARFYANNVPAKALDLLEGIDPSLADQYGIRSRDIAMTKAMAFFACKKSAEAEQVMDQVMSENPKDETLLSMVVQVSVSFGRFTNALTAVERELQIAPTNAAALVVKGYLHMQTGSFAEAIPPLDRVLALDPNNNTARFNRGISYLRMGELDKAKKDYNQLEKVYPNAFRVYYGLGEIAWQRKETNAAIHYYQLYMSNSVPNSEESKKILERLQALSGHSP
jgi:tetratricopeptide (TPR) repeat protein